MKYLSTQKNTEAGFTILESIISIFILLTAITGPLVYVTSGFKAARSAKYQMIAYYLGSETIEQIKFYRDSNEGNIDWWQLGIPNASLSNPNQNNFDWNPATESFFGCGNTNGTGDGHECGELYVNSVTGKYSYDTTGDNEISIFTRDVKRYVKVLDTDDEYAVTMTISWLDERGITGSIDITEHIFGIQ